MFGRLFRVLCLLISFVVCFVAGVAYYKYIGIPATRAFLKAPLSSARVMRRDWTASQELQYARDQSSVHAPRYVETSLLPIIITEKRLSESYPVAKFGGAITVVGSTVVIMDRLGAFYRYEMKDGPFAKLPLPTLPNNLEAYLHQRSNIIGVDHVNLAGPEAQMEFRAHAVTFLPDRKELAVLFDQFDAAAGALRTVISVIPIDVATLTATGDWRTIYTSETFPPGVAGFTGGRMAYRGNDELYVSVGDHAIYTPQVSQDLSSTFGKVIDLNLATKKWRVVSLGLRNAEGLTFLKSGELVAVDNGPRGGDDLDVISDGDNYGWPRVSLGTTYDSYVFNGGIFSSGNYSGSLDVDASHVGRIIGYKAPIFAWVPSIAPSQLIQIENFDPRWDGDLLVGSMKGESLFRLRMEAGRVLYSEPIWIGQRIRDLIQANDGTILIWTDDDQLLLVTVDKDKLAEKRLAPAFFGAVESAGCLGCHHFGPTHPGDTAPSFSNLFNRPIASDVFPYSPGLRSLHGTWTKERLIQFLNDPTKLASGTVMPSMRMLGLSAEQVRNVVNELARASQAPSDAAN